MDIHDETIFSLLCLLGLALCLAGYEANAKSAKNADYWADIVNLCRVYSGATHPPCHKSNGAETILDHVRQNCQTDKKCLKKAVSLCVKYSSGTHPPCHASNGIDMVVGELERVAKSYSDKSKKELKVKAVDAIDIHSGENGNASMEQ